MENVVLHVYRDRFLLVFYFVLFMLFAFVFDDVETSVMSLHQYLLKIVSQSSTPIQKLCRRFSLPRSKA